MRRVVPLLPIALLLGAEAAQAQREPPPRAVIGQALAAHERGVADSVARAWRGAGDPVARLGLATLDRLAYRYASADSAYAALATPTAGAAASPVVGAVGLYARLGRAEGLLARGLVAAADTAYAAAIAAARAAGDSLALADAWLGAAAARLRATGGPGSAAAIDSATRAVPRAVPRAAPVGELTALRAGVLCARAAHAALVGDTAAPALADSGLALAQRAGALRLGARCRIARAQHFIRVGDMGPAAVALAHADTTLRAVGDRALHALARERRARLNLLLGHFPIAQEYLGDALAAARETEQLGATAAVLLDLGEISTRSGDSFGAAAYARRARALAEQAGDGVLLGAATALGGAIAMRIATLAEAGRSLDDALARATALGDADTRRAVLYSRADLALRRGDWAGADAALAAYERLVRETDAYNWAAALSSARATLALRRGDAAQAARLLEERLAGYVPTQWLFRAQGLASLARARVGLGDTVAAERLLREAADTLDYYRDQGRATASLRAATLQQARAVFGGESGTHERVIAAVAATGRVAAAFDLVERDRARELREVLTGTRRIATDTVRPTREQAVRERTPDEIAREMAEPTWRTAARARWAGADSVARALPDDRMALLLFAAGRGGAPTTLFVVTRRGGATAHLLPSVDSLAPAIERLVTLTEAGVAAPEPAAALGRALLAPALAALPATTRRLVIVPDDVLHRVPFALLDAGSGPLVERYTLSLAPSASVATHLWSRPRTAGPARVLAFGDPPSDPGVSGDPTPATLASRETTADASRGTAPLFPRLRASADEARLAASLAPGSVARVGAEATRAALARAPLDSFRVLHLATHALVDDWRPEASLIVLGADRGGDGYVSASQLAAMRIRADLVVLSACRSAGGPIVGGEGVRGLTAPLLQAGARGVLATLWDVGDRSALAAMRVFYRELAAGRAPDEALARTQRELRRRGAPAQEWGAYVLVGDGTAPLAAPARRARWLRRLVGARG